VVQLILTAAINWYDIPSKRRRRVLQVSANNQQWRAVAKKHLWTRLEPRELTNLLRLLALAVSQVLLTVELNMQFGDVAPRLASVEPLGRFPELLGGYEVFWGVKWLKANIGDRRDDTPIHICHL